MKLIIAGSREYDMLLPEDIQACVEHYNLIVTEVVSGTARGVDKCGEGWATAYHIPIARFPADWDHYGKAAGHIRNKQMAEYADALLIIWNGESRGSKNMKETMIKLGKPYYEVTP